MKFLMSRYHFQIVLFLLMLVSFSYWYLGKNNNSSNVFIAQQIEEQIQEDQFLLDIIAHDLQEILLINGKDSYEERSLFYQKKYKDRFAFYLYENQQLELWTDNHIPLPEHIDDLKEPTFQSFGAYKVLVNPTQFHQFNLIALQIIKFSYPWQNEYLVNQMADYLNIPTQLSINTKNTGSPVTNADQKILFYVDTQEMPSHTDLNLGAFLLFLLSFFLLSNIFQRLLKKLISRKKLLATLIYTIGLLSWYFIHLFLKIPEQLFESQFFSASLYAYLYSQNSLGNLFFLSLIFLFIVVFIIKNPPQFKPRLAYIYFFIAFIFIAYYGIVFLMKSLIFDSQILLNLYQLASLDIYSYLVIWIVFIMQLSLLLIAFMLFGNYKENAKAEIHIWIGLLLFGIAPAFYDETFSFSFWLLQLGGSLFLVAMFYMQKHRYQRRLGEVVFYLIFFTFISTIILNQYQEEKEKNFRETAALTLDQEKDPFLEEHFLSSLPFIQNDSQLNLLTLKEDFSNSDDSLLQFISERYFSNFESIYNISLIHCDELTSIRVLPENYETSCYSYFEERIQLAKSVIKPDTLYLIDGDFQYRNYIGQIKVQQDSIHEFCIFIEFVSRVQPREAGLPAILEKSHVLRSPLLRNYSFAIYQDSMLVDMYGKFDYKQKLNDYHLNSYHHFYFEKDDFQHYIHSKAPGQVLMISLAQPGPLQRLASFAFIFLLYSLLTFILYVLFNSSSLQSSIIHFQGRLQYSMVVLLLFSFVLIGVSSLYYIIYLNQSKNSDNLMEKAHSVLIELEHKLSGMDEFTPQDQEYVESLLVKFSEVFFTDITLFTREGKLLASSRPEMFSAELLSNRMDADAFYGLTFQKNSFFIHEEKIGTQNYLSAYLPFRNQENKSVAYLNLPYFAKQYELEEEVTGFIVAFLNIYLFLLFITILITIMISRYLSKPLNMLKSKIANLDLQDYNEKIEWDKNDEIGELIREYNRMVDELSQSAKKLALSQRESAWREMAQQIAHEIKNPLTPMKLNVQYLEKAWDDKVDDYEVRMKRITQGLKEQIDVLSEIAGQFSTFAAIDKIYPQPINLMEIIESVVDLFKGAGHTSFDLQLEATQALVYADKNQMIRVFNNLYKNAVQATETSHNPHINTLLEIINEGVYIEITDNGIGIPIAEQEQIFEPRFTTKSGGMGLGLALVKKMLENAGGRIEVYSQLKKGSTFKVYLPLMKSN